MRWAAPAWLYALWALVPLALVLLALLRRRRRKLEGMAPPEVWPVLTPERHERKARSRVFLWLAGTALGLAALARPQWGYHLEELRQEGLDLIVVLDTSNSMLAEDIKPNRLQQAKWGIKDLTGQLQGDRVGLIAFAGSGFLSCPLTADYDAFEMTLDDVYAGIIPRGGTAIEQALYLAAKSFEDESKADRAILLITDGEDHEGDPLRQTKTLKEARIRVFAVGAGTPEGGLIPSDGSKQAAGWLKNERGEVVQTRLQENVLERLAIDTGGMYVRTAPGDFGLERIYRQGLSRLQKGEHEGRTLRVYQERFMWPLSAAALCFLLEALLSERRRRREVTP